MQLAFYTQGIEFNKFLVHLECIPFPGPPDEKEDALPSIVLIIFIISIF